MPSFLDANKHRDRKEFYKLIFNADKFMEPYPELAADLKNIGIVSSDTKGLKNSVGRWVNVVIAHVQYIMVDQEVETQKQIIDTASTKLTTFLKNVFRHQYPNSNDDGVIEYWNFIKSSLKESLSTDYNEIKVKDYIESMQLYGCLYYKRHPYLLTDFPGRVNDISKILDLNLRARYVTCQVMEDSIEVVRKAFGEITTYNIPYAASLVLIAGGVAAWGTGMTVGAGIISAVNVIGSTLYAWGCPKLTTEAEHFFLKNGRQEYYNEHGKKLNICDEANQFAITYGIKKSLHQFIAGHPLTKKMLPLDGNNKVLHEVYIPTYENFPRISDITNTQLKKMKPHKTVAEAKSFKIVETNVKSERQISLPENFKSKLIQCSNQSLLAIASPGADSKITPEELENMMGPRGDIIAKKFGQSGVKILSQHNFWIKDKNSKKRILLEQVEDETILVDGKNQNVPTFQPTKVVYK